MERGLSLKEIKAALGAGITATQVLIRLAYDPLDNIASAVEFAHDPSVTNFLAMLPIVPGAAKPGLELAKDLAATESKVVKKGLSAVADDAASAMARKEALNVIPGDLIAKIQEKIGAHPKVVDPRTGRNIGFPTGIGGRVDPALKVSWDSKLDQGHCIAEWSRRGYPTPLGGWPNYDIHHIQPREFGGTNDFWNLVPVDRETHQELFNEFWREFICL